MATYTVKANQNLFDIAMKLYGSIEGLFDLLISNSWLNMTTDLNVGMELEYHDYFVVNGDIQGEIQSQNYLPANGERHVYLKHPNEPLVFMCQIDPDEHSASFIASGSGDMLIDWGDNSDLEKIELGVDRQTVLHYFNSKTDGRRIKVYGTFQLMYFDTTNLGGALFLTKPLTVDEYVCHSTVSTLSGLFLFDGTVSVDLRETKIHDLLPIADMSLQILDLRHVNFSSIDVLDVYLQYLVGNYGNRRDCTVYLTTEPSENGMKAIETIIGEDSWNESGNWVFNINDKIYTRK